MPTIENAEQIKYLRNARYGVVRYVELEGEKYVFRGDLSKAIGYSASGLRVPDEYLITADRTYITSSNSRVTLVNMAGVKYCRDEKKMTRGSERLRVCSWVLAALYGEGLKESAQVELFSPKIELTAEQIEKLAEVVIEKLIARLMRDAADKKVGEAEVGSESSDNDS